jgi:predicted dehydrogenase
MKQYRVAIIGTGASVGNHLDAVRYVGERAVLVAAVDQNEDRVKAVCAAHNIPHWYTNITDMLSKEQPDLVQIVTPHATHTELTIQSLVAGAWVYCEKPLCGSLADFDQIQQTEELTRRYVSTVSQWRFGSAVAHLRKLIADQAMGRLLVGICNTLWYRDMNYYQAPWRGKWATEFGGPTMTLGIHLMDLFLWLMGDWQEVQAMIGTLDRAIEVEDVSMALVRFANGGMGSIVNSALSPRQETYMRLDFQRSTVEVSALYRYSNANWRYSIPDSSTDGDLLPRWQNISDDYQGSHGVQLAHLLDSMDRGERPAVSGLEARRIIEFIASLYKSAAQGQPIRCGTITPDDPFYYAMHPNNNVQG